MRIERHKNFITQEECAALNAWVDEAVKNRWMDVGVDGGNFEYALRFTSRMYGSRYQYPQIVRDVSDRVRSFAGVADFPTVSGHGRDGVVVSCTFDGGDVYAHKDPTHFGVPVLRCNIMTRKADAGADLYIGGQLVDVEVGELHCYLVSEFEHFVTKAVGPTSRVMWMFGAAVPTKDWESGKIVFGGQH